MNGKEGGRAGKQEGGRRGKEVGKRGDRKESPHTSFPGERVSPGQTTEFSFQLLGLLIYCCK